MWAWARGVRSCSALGLCTWLSATPASAQPLSLSWSAPVHCGSAELLRERVSRELGADAASVRAQVSITKQPPALALRVVIDSASDHAERELTAESCEAALDAAALLIALAVRSGVASVQRAQPEVAPRSAPPAPSRPPDDPFRLTVGLGAALDAGTLPRASVGPSGQLALGTRRVRLALGFTYLPAQRARLRSGAVDAAAEISLIEATASGCYRWLAGPFALGPCVAAEIGQLSGRPEAVRVPVRGAARVHWLGVAAQAELALGGAIALQTDFGAVALLRRPLFVVAPEGILHEPAKVALRAGLQLVVMLP